jgi:hypothetical protein
MGRSFSRLARYDRTAARLARLTHRLVWAPLVFAVTIVVVVLVTGGGLLFGVDVATVTTIATSTIGIAATLGGLSTTIFFLTAQLKVGGISQYGLTELYRLRDHLPLMLTTILAILFGFLSVASQRCGDPGLTACASYAGVAWVDPIVIDPHRQWAMLALLLVGQLMLMSIVLGLTLISNLEPVTVARRYALRVKPGDAQEWGLFNVVFRDDEGYRTEIESYTLESNRRNFGLRDPIMPIHELVLVAPNQRLGQLLGVMLARVAAAYGLQWMTQAPDVIAWAHVRPRRRLPTRRRRPQSGRALQKARDRARGRFSLAILMIHYLRRMPFPEKTFDAYPDVRRQAAVFQLCRLIVTLADERTIRRYPDAADVIDLALNAVLHIELDAGEKQAFGKTESLWALAAAARVLAEAGRVEQAHRAVDILAQCAVFTIHIGERREFPVFENLGAESALASRYVERKNEFAGTGGMSALARPDKCDPWLEP